MTTSAWFDNAGTLSTSDADAADHLREVSVVPETVITDRALDLIRRERTTCEMTRVVPHPAPSRRHQGVGGRTPYAALKERQ